MSNHISNFRISYFFFFISTLVYAQESVLHISQFKLYKDAELIREWNSGYAVIPKIYLDTNEDFDSLRLFVKSNTVTDISNVVYKQYFFCNTSNPSDKWGQKGKELVFKKEQIFEALSSCKTKSGVITIQSTEGYIATTFLLIQKE